MATDEALGSGWYHSKIFFILSLWKPFRRLHGSPFAQFSKEIGKARIRRWLVHIRRKYKLRSRKPQHLEREKRIYC